MNHKLDELAAKGQAKKKSRSARKQKKRRPKKRKSSGRKLSKVLKLTLRRESFMIGVSVLASVPMVIGVGMYFVVGVRDNLVIAIVFGSAAIALGAIPWSLGASVRKELSWLGGVGLGLDVDGYLRALDREQKRGSLVVRVTFASPVPHEARHTVSDAAVGASDAKSAEFQGHELVVQSQSMQTYFERAATSSSITGSFHSNSKLHQWFCTLVNKGLVTINETFPIERIEVSMKGN